MLILCFLQELLKKGHSPSTLKVYVAAIVVTHAPIHGQSVGWNNLVFRFLKGYSRLNSPHPVTVPTWDLPTVLRALKSPPFGLLQSVDLRTLTLKTVLLLALASLKCMGDLQALSVSTSCLEFRPNDSKIVQKPRQGYILKVLFNKSQNKSQNKFLYKISTFQRFSSLEHFYKGGPTSITKNVHNLFCDQRKYENKIANEKGETNGLQQHIQYTRCIVLSLLSDGLLHIHVSTAVS